MGNKEQEKKKRRAKVSQKPLGIAKKESERPKVEVLPEVPYPDSFEEVSKSIPFNEDFHDLFRRAEKISKKLKHNYIGTEHVLLAFYQTPNTKVKDFLEFLLIRQDHLLLQVVRSVGIGDSISNVNVTLFPSRTEQAVISAASMAKKDRLRELGPEYVFLALMDQSEGIACNLVRDNARGRVRDLDERLQAFRVSLQPKALPSPE